MLRVVATPWKKRERERERERERDTVPKRFIFIAIHASPNPALFASSEEFRGLVGVDEFLGIGGVGNRKVWRYTLRRAISACTRSCRERSVQWLIVRALLVSESIRVERHEADRQTGLYSAVQNSCITRRIFFFFFFFCF